MLDGQAKEVCVVAVNNNDDRNCRECDILYGDLRMKRCLRLQKKWIQDSPMILPVSVPPVSSNRQSWGSCFVPLLGVRGC